VLSIVRQQNGEVIWGVVSLHAERTPLEFDLSRCAPRQGSFGLFDLLAQAPWAEAGRDRWSFDAARALHLSPVPFQPYFWRIEAADTARAGAA
jgi:hypothetical protein